MKKITISIGLLAGILTSNAQDTICTMIRPHEVVNFNHKTSKVIDRYNNKSNVVIKVGSNKILCLHLYDEKHRLRKVINYYEDGTTYTQILTSKNDVYFTASLDIVKVEVRKSKFIIPTRHVKHATNYNGPY